MVRSPWDGWRNVPRTALGRSLTAVQPLGHDIHTRAKILIRIPTSNTGDGDSTLLRNACTHLRLTCLHDVTRHSKIFRRGHNVRKLWECLQLAVVQRGAEGHTYSDNNLSGWYKTRHVAYDAVWSGNVYRPHCMTSVYGHHHCRKKTSHLTFGVI